MRILHICYFGNTGFSGIREVVEAIVLPQISLGNDIRVCLLEPCLGYDSYPYEHFKRTHDFKQFVKEFKPNLVIFHGLFYFKYIKYYKVLLKLNIPYIIKLHGAASFKNYAKNHLKKYIAIKLLFGKFIMKAAALSFLNNEERLNFALKSLNSNYIIEPNGISSIESKKSHVPGEKIIISFIGRMAYHHKGLDILIKAIKRINNMPIKDLVEFHFYGPLYDNTFKEDIIPYKEFVHWHPPVVGEEKSKVYKSTDVFILTSRFEGMPMGVLEALSNGIPCLITPQTNMADIIITHHSGWVTELDETKIVECIENMINDVNFRYDELSKNANESVRGYLWEEIVKNSINQYNEILNSLISY